MVYLQQRICQHVDADVLDRNQGSCARKRCSTGCIESNLFVDRQKCLKTENRAGCNQRIDDLRCRCPRIPGSELHPGLERLVDWDLPDEAVISLPALRKIRERSVSRKLVGVEIGGRPMPQLNFTKWGVFKDGNKVGKVTSAVYSPRLKKNIGYAWLPFELAELGNKVDVETPHGQATAQVVRMPFVDPAKEIPRS